MPPRAACRSPSRAGGGGAGQAVVDGATQAVVGDGGKGDGLAVCNLIRLAQDMEQVGGGFDQISRIRKAERGRVGAGAKADLDILRFWHGDVQPDRGRGRVMRGKLARGGDLCAVWQGKGVAEDSLQRLH